MSNAKFIFPDLDEIGIDTLDAISFAPRFNEYMFKTIEQYCSGNILEIGSGIGNISKHFIDKKASISLTDIRDNYVDILKENYGNQTKEIFNLDITDPDFDKKYADKFENYDTIFALNVVEHIKDDNLAIVNCKKLLKNGGQLVILVPAYQWMYNSFDTALEHYRRYTKKRLNGLLSKHLNIIHHQYFNVFGMAGWFVSGKILRKKTIPRNQMELYDKLIWISKTLDKIVFNKIGLSVISVGKKS
ncbi:MAG: class I SAM-dependent methyltransferase [Saprospiraceae bacterium]|nr:class I SAM-dependent methyltransferase [Bacteroidia bacterium]NNE14265.1 class I SAM-dependent methyltransferase [Saprospiraceae bacterium]NNL92491.1 class I SAM-dependent methyltransferase [Saprospiraceae bacterium]